MLRTHLLSCLGLSNTDALDDSQGFRELGLDSIHSVIFCRTLEKQLNCTLLPTLLYDYPDLMRLCEYLMKHDLREYFSDHSPTLCADDPTKLSEEALLALLELQLTDKSCL